MERVLLKVVDENGRMHISMNGTNGELVAAMSAVVANLSANDQMPVPVLGDILTGTAQAILDGQLEVMEICPDRIEGGRMHENQSTGSQL